MDVVLLRMPFTSVTSAIGKYSPTDMLRAFAMSSLNPNSRAIFPLALAAIL